MLIILAFVASTASSGLRTVCVLHEQQKLTASDGEVGDSFGGSGFPESAVSVDGHWAAVGALGDDDLGSQAGAAYMFRYDDNGTPSDRTDDSWVEHQKLTALDGLLGSSVSLKGIRLLVGAPIANGGGSAFVFWRDGNDTPNDLTDDLWKPQGSLVATETTNGDNFGVSVSLASEWAVVGAHGRDEPLFNSGAAYVFRRQDNGTPSDYSDDTWSEWGSLTHVDVGHSDRFGGSVTISGDWIAVGAAFDKDASGEVYLFRRDDHNTPLDQTDDSWVSHQKLTEPLSETVNNRFGASVSIDQNRLLVGAKFADVAVDGGGAVYVFVCDDNETPADTSDDVWCHEATLTAPDAVNGTLLGQSVSLNGSWAVAGTSELGIEGIGSAYVFHRIRERWVHQTKLTLANGLTNELFGTSVSIDGEHVFVGVPEVNFAQSKIGAVYWFSVGSACMSLADFADFQVCFSGDGQGIFPNCERFDSEPDGDIDLHDHGNLLHSFVGP